VDFKETLSGVSLIRIALKELLDQPSEYQILKQICALTVDASEWTA
jgi:hypothetical protein